MSYRLLHDAVRHHAAIRPDHPAVEVGDRQVSYAGLGATMDKIAGLLHLAGVARHDRVALLADNGIEACQAIYGIMRADAAFVALNPGYPAQRIAAIIDQSEASAFACTRELLSVAVQAAALLASAQPRLFLLLDGTSDEARIALDQAGAGDRFAQVAGLAEIEAVPPLAAPSRNIEEDLAYILFTSGTTGTPKGVMVSHRAVKSTIAWGVDHFAIAPEDRLSNHSRLSFDVSLFDIFCAAFAGATLLPLVRKGDCAFPGDFIRKRRVSLWFSVPSVINLMVQSRQLAAGPFPDLRAALFAGEPLTPAMAAAWRKHQPQVPIYNLYGPTEAAIVCTVHNIGVDSPFEDDKPVPIGIETRDSELLVLHPDRDEAATPGEVGRLMICGSQLADGYWRRPDLTERAFRRNPLKADFAARMYDTGDLAWKDDAGRIHFVGRADSQVKIMGFRVELGEIEAALNGCRGIHEGIALFLDGAQPEIVAIVTVEPGAAFDADAVLAHCARTMPAYMLPRRVIPVQDFPRNLNGKIDRKAALALMAGEAS